MVLPYKRNDCFTIFWVVFEVLMVPLMISKTSGESVSKGENSKSSGHNVLSKNRIPNPFKNFAKIVRARNVFEETTCKKKPLNLRSAEYVQN